MSATKGFIISCFDRTGHIVQPWLDNGWSAITIDQQKQVNPHPHRHHLEVDILSLDLEGLIADVGPFMCVASPPCTHVAASGCAHFKTKGLTKLIEALTLLNKVRSAFEDTPYNDTGVWAIENPVGMFSPYWREPDYIFNPYDYTGWEIKDHYKKKTCIWANPSFKMPPPFKSPLVKGLTPDTRLHSTYGGGDGDARSVMPLGYSRAVYEANCPEVFK